MKNLKFILLIVIISLFTLQSCKTDNEVVVKEDATLDSTQMDLNAFAEIEENVPLRMAFDVMMNTDDLDFSFIYPIQVTYNDNSAIQIENKNNLVSQLENETDSHYITNITMPFNIKKINGSLININTDIEFMSHLKNTDCAADIFLTDCFDYVYPIQVVTTSCWVYTLYSDNQFYEFLEYHEYEWCYDFIYPFEVIMHDGYHYTLYNSNYLCNLLDYCEDYEEEDEDPVSVTNLSLTVGDCVEVGNDTYYQVSVGFDFENAPGTQFNCMKTSITNGDLDLGTFLLADLPVTVLLPAWTDEPQDYILVTLNGCGGQNNDCDELGNCTPQDCGDPSPN